MTELLPILEEALGLPNVKIEEVKTDREGNFIIRVKSTKEETICRICGKPTESYGKGQIKRLRHLPILGRKTYIEIQPPRGICHNCKDHPTTTQQSDWYNRKSHCTKAYEKHILLSLINSTISDVSIKEDIGYDAIQGIVDRNILEKINWNEVKAIGLLGLDEISLKKGHQDFVTLITSRNEGKIKILGVIKGREKGQIKAFLSVIPKSLRRTIIGICCDMYEGYANAAKEIFSKDIPIIVDRYHVAKLYRRCLVKLRKKELSRLKKELAEEKYKNLQPAIRILCRNKEYVTSEEKKILNKLFKYSPALKVAHKLCCKLTGIYNSKIGIRLANKKIEEWMQEVEASGLKCFNTFMKTLRKWKYGIINYFKRRDTSGFVEGFNNKVKVLKRRCYGIFDIKTLFKRLFLDMSGYALFANNQPVVCNTKS